MEPSEKPQLCIHSPTRFSGNLLYNNGNKLQNTKYTSHLLFERVLRLFGDGVISSKYGDSKKSWSETVHYITKYVFCI